MIAADNLVAVPLADGLRVRRDRCVEGIQRAGPPRRVLRIRIANFHFLALLHRHPRVVARIREAQEHARVRDVLLLQELAAHHEVRELPSLIPPQAHSPRGGGDTILNLEATGTGLLPVLQRLFAQQRNESLFASHRRHHVIQILGRNLKQRTHLSLAVEHFRVLRLKLNLPVCERAPLVAIFVPRVEGHQVHMAVENVNTLAAPEHNLHGVPVAEDLFDIERRRDAVRARRGEARTAFSPHDVLLTVTFLFVRHVKLVLRRDPFAFAVDDRAVHAPPLADTFLHDVILDRREPARARIRRADAAIENARVAPHLRPPAPARQAPLKLHAEVEVRELVVRGDRAVAFTRDVNDVLAI